MKRNSYLIGSPVGQSPSAKIMNAMFAKINFPSFYQKEEVSEAHLDAFVESFKREGGLFFNVTVPHKRKIFKYLDEFESAVSDILAASCVLNEGGKLWGYNTDLVGFSNALNKHNLSLRGEEVDVLGAGGASGAIIYDLIRRGAEVRVLNRTLENAKEIARRFGCEYGSLANAGDSCKKLVLNTTKVGMFPNKRELIISKNQISSYENVADIVYNPYETNFLKTAKEVGSKPLTGLGLDMLVLLLAKSFEIGTGRVANLNLMYDVAKRELRIR